MPDTDPLAAVLTRILQRVTPTNQWAMTWDELTINATLNITPEERAAIGIATGKTTIADPYARGVTFNDQLPPRA